MLSVELFDGQRNYPVREIRLVLKEKDMKRPAPA
jgi:hypothetical protein